jgi:hypothetical protein
MIVFLVPNGPYRKQSQGINLSALIGVFENQNLRSAAFGYFGHIYAFWAFTPLMLQTYNDFTQKQPLIFLFCLSSSLVLVDCLCIEWLPLTNLRCKTNCLPLCFCLVRAVLFFLSICFSVNAFLFLLLLGMVVVADSPLLSTLVAQNAPAEKRNYAYNE